MPTFETIAEALDFVRDREETITVLPAGNVLKMNYNNGPAAWGPGFPAGQTIMVYPTSMRANPKVTVFNQMYGSKDKKVKPLCFEPSRLR